MPLEQSTKTKKSLDFILIKKTGLYLVLFFAILMAPAALSKALDTPYPLAAVVSNSMWPAIKAGDIVVIKGVYEKNDLEIGDIVVYQDGSDLIIHRVIELKQDSLIVKGDANTIADDPVLYKEVVGKAMTSNGKLWRVPRLGELALWLRGNAL